MELLKKLTQTGAASGSESAISDVIKNEIKDYADEIYEDTLGNLIARKKGTKKKIMLAAHMDEIGVIITYIEENGFIRFSNVGGLYQKELLGRRVVFKNNIVGVIYTENENKDLKAQKMYIDIGVCSKEEVMELLDIGDTGVFEGSFQTRNDRVISKALDNRAGCYALIEAMKKTKSDNDIYFVFTSQEEVGLRGARTAAYSISPDAAIAVDVTDTGDTPNCDKMAVSLGKGAAIKVMDRSVICHREVRNALIELAKNNKIPYQLENLTDGGTDAGAIHITKDGIKTGGISIPTRYIHSPSEMADINDIQAVIDLVVAFLENYPI